MNRKEVFGWGLQGGVAWAASLAPEQNGVRQTLNYALILIVGSKFLFKKGFFASFSG